MNEHEVDTEIFEALVQTASVTLASASKRVQGLQLTQAHKEAIVDVLATLRLQIDRIMVERCGGNR